VRQYVVKYLVETYDVDDQGLTAMTRRGIPSIGEPYQVGNDYDMGAFVRSYQAKLVD